MDYYALCICTAGEINIEIDRQKYKVDADSFLIAAPSTIVKFGKTSDDFTMKLLFFDKNFLIKNISNPFIIEKMNLFSKGSYSIVKLRQPILHFCKIFWITLDKKSKKQENLQRRLSVPLFSIFCWETAEIMEQENAANPEKEEGKKIFI